LARYNGYGKWASEEVLEAGLAGVYVLALAAHILSPSLASADERFAINNIRVLDRITEILPGDLNGDGLKDLVILHTKGFPPEEQRWVSIFWQRSEGAFSSAADFTAKLPDSVVAVDVGDVCENPGEELVLLTPSGVYRLSYPDSASVPQLLPLVEGVFGALPPAREHSPWIDFVQDWDGDGHDDIAILSLDRLLVFKGGGETPFCTHDAVQIDVRSGLVVHEDEDGSTFNAVSATRHYPYLAARDVDGDGDLDLVSHYNDQLQFYLQNDGKFSQEADARVWLELLTDEEKTRRDFDLGIAVEDFDGDGTADVFAGKSTRRGVADFFSEVSLYFGDGTLDFDRKPDWTTAVQGMSWGKWGDLDGDGRMELVLPVVNLGITDLVRILLTKSVKIEFYFYFIHGDHSLSDKPDFVREVKLDVGLDEGGQAQIVNFEGDYDGDGRKDMVVATGKTELSVFPGTAPETGELFSSKPREKISVETFGSFRPVDLNGDGLSDIILYYKDDPEMGSRARIIMNLGGW
jgi:hypothetical protein